LPELIVFNKTDVAARSVVPRLLALHEGSMAVTARNDEGLDLLRERLSEARRADHIVAAFVVPYDHGEVVAGLHRDGEVLEESFEEQATHLKVRGSRATLRHYDQYRV
jgi:GTP-binding protein HflX